MTNDHSITDVPVRQPGEQAPQQAATLTKLHHRVAAASTLARPTGMGQPEPQGPGQMGSTSPDATQMSSGRTRFTDWAAI